MEVKEEKQKADRLISVSFPKGLLEEVDFIVNRTKTKYVSRADFCRSAVRQLINKEREKDIFKK